MNDNQILNGFPEAKARYFGNIIDWSVIARRMLQKQEPRNIPIQYQASETKSHYGYLHSGVENKGLSRLIHGKYRIHPRYGRQFLGLEDW